MYKVKYSSRGQCILGAAAVFSSPKFRTEEQSEDYLLHQNFQGLVLNEVILSKEFEQSFTSKSRSISKVQS